MSLGEGAEDRTAHHDEDPVTREIAPELDPEPTKGGPGDDDKGDPPRTHHPQTHRMTGTPNSRCWMMMTGEGARERSIDGIPKLSMSESNSGRSVSGSAKWLVKTFGMRRPTKGSRTLSQSNMPVRMITGYSRGGWTTY